MTAVIRNSAVLGSSQARRPARRFGLAAVTAVLAVTLNACGAGSPATPDTSPAASASSSAARSVPGPTLVVTVPDLVTAPGVASASQPAAPGVATPAQGSAAAALSSAAERNTPAPAGEPAAGSTPPGSVSTPDPKTSQRLVSQAAGGPASAGPSAPPGDGLNVSLANCDGCTVLGTHKNVTGDRSAALVGTGSRAILLSVAADGAAAGVINVPYGVAFPEPGGGVLACAESRCVVQGRQSDGRAILSAFELTDTGAWRDISGDDAFPSATEQAAVVDIDGSLAIAVQDQADAAAVWLLYTWSGDRYVVVGCSADGSAPTSVDAVSPDQCLS